MTAARQNDSWLRLIVVILAVILFTPMLMMLFAFPMMGGWMMGPGYGGPTPIWGWVMMLVSLLVVLALGYVLYRALAGDGAGGDAALEELRLAYARGDLSEEEFETRRERLRREQ
ncbi:putative membrane protein [Haladaptatus litoreus]|uniref:Putative membrane protein n=1 Tax=Haladaptatus litoreus TaxID=553468 RepID=A0A1N7CYR6_9EURY|nr:SHOCT domain-containing protein [Haladaptatus litoreus]SIR68605.1 putative membrane protein [Haladaptatus litoreus]